MARRRWIVSPKESIAYEDKSSADLALLSKATPKPVFYHCISRVVDRRFAFQGDDKERFRMFMRMYENFTG
ncbi:MAG: hypothetical protein RLZZ214_261, partial [Verrucomicrobiota bacterium]